MSCNSRNVVYVIHCARCQQLQYVGQTTRQLNERLTNHRYDVRHSKGSCPLIFEHFNSPGHSADDMRIQPIEHVAPTATETRKQRVKRLLDREKFWQLELQTMAPYGLNESLDNVGLASTLQCVRFQFNRQLRRPRPRGRHRGRVGPGGPRPEDAQTIVHRLFDVYHTQPRQTAFIIKSLLQQPKSVLKQIGQVVQDIDPNTTHHELRILRLIDDVCLSKVLRPPTLPVAQPTPRRARMVIYMQNRAVDMLDVSTLLFTQRIRNHLPDPVRTGTPPLVQYKYTKNIGHDIFNYADAARSYHDPTTMDCNCANSPDVYNPCGHIVTGDLPIRNKHLRRLCSRGPKVSRTPTD